MDSTRASAIRLLTSSRSMILSGPGRALKPAPMWRGYIVSSGGVGPRRPFLLPQKREQSLGERKAAVDWAKTRPDVKAAGVGVTGWCWGGSTVYQVAATNRDVRGAVAWYGPPARPYQGASGSVTGFDLATEIHR